MSGVYEDTLRAPMWVDSSRSSASTNSSSKLRVVPTIHALASVAASRPTAKAEVVVWLAKMTRTSTVPCQVMLTPWALVMVAVGASVELTASSMSRLGKVLYSPGIVSLKEAVFSVMGTLLGMSFWEMTV